MCPAVILFGGLLVNVAVTATALGLALSALTLPDDRRLIIAFESVLASLGASNRRGRRALLLGLSVPLLPLALIGWVGLAAICL